MTEQRRFLLILAAAALLFGVFARAQDAEPSLGDVARQSRQQKQSASPSTGSVAAAAQPASTSTTSASTTVGPASSAAAKNGTKAPAKTPKHIITEDEIAGHGSAVAAAASGASPSGAKLQPVNDQQTDSANGKKSAESWTSAIQQLKSNVAELEAQIKNVSDSIQYAGANCVSGCVEWNENQQRKQQQVESMKSQLEELKKQLEETQEKARKEGYGSSVYEP